MKGIPDMTAIFMAVNTQTSLLLPRSLIIMYVEIKGAMKAKIPIIYSKDLSQKDFVFAHCINAFNIFEEAFAQFEKAEIP